MSLDVHISEPDEFNSQELHSSIEKIALAKNINDFEYDADCISGKRANYIANVFRVEIKDTGGDKKRVSIIVKTLVNTERQVLFHKLHEREVFAYNDVISKFKDMQNILYEHERLVLSDCLYSNTENSTEIIILEDLRTKGFQIDNNLVKFQHLDIEQISAVIGELAKFHALSFIFEKQDSERFDELKSGFHDILYQDHFLNKSQLRNFFFESFETSIKHVADDEARKKLEKVHTKLLEMLQMYTQPGKTNVLCHGDCWVNNMLFKNEVGLQTKVCFIDFQAMRYANPVTDIIYFLYICTDSIFRSEHFEKLKIVYYDNLKIFLSKFEITVDDIYSREEFNADIEEFLPYGLLVALIELRIITMTLEEDAILKGSNLQSIWDLSEVPGEVDLFKSRVNDVVKEAVDNGVLDKLLEKLND